MGDGGNTALNNRSDKNAGSGVVSGSEVRAYSLLLAPLLHCRSLTIELNIGMFNGGSGCWKWSCN